MREAATDARTSMSREAVARDLAARVVAHLRQHAAEASEPALAVIGELKRAVAPSPALTLATDPDIDTLSLFTEARLSSFRDRNGWPISSAQDWQDVEASFACVERKLSARYLKIIRS